MQPQKNSRHSWTLPLRSASAEPKQTQNSVNEARQVNKLRMMMNAVQSLNSQQQATPSSQS